MSELRFRGGRSLALAAGIVVAAVTFTLLTAQTRASALHVRGTIAGSYRTAYDILVRPHGTRSALERRRGLVRANYLSGIVGGINFAQYRTVQRIRGVTGAAPIANLGFAFPSRRLRVPINRLLTPAPFHLYRIRTRWVANGGLSRYPDATLYVYYTRRDRFVLRGPNGVLGEVGPGRQFTQSCAGFLPATEGQTNGPFDPQFRAYLECFSARSRRNSLSAPGEPLPRGFVGSETEAHFPLAVAAIDPAAEAKLVHLDRALVAGRYLRPTDRLPLVHRFLPVLASTHSFVDEKLAIEVERLRVPPATDVPRALASGACVLPRTPCPERVPAPRGATYRNAREFLAHLQGRTIDRRTVPIGRIYQNLLRSRHGDVPAGQIGSNYWTASQVRYHVLGRDRLEPVPVRNGALVWAGYMQPPRDNQDVQFRRLHVRVAKTDAGLQVVGRFDPSRLPEFSPLSRVPLETYFPPELTPANAAARRALHGRRSRPNQNLADYVAQPPLVLAPLSQVNRFFLDPDFFAYVSPRVRRAPISVIRVRVKGVNGPDALSRARVRVVAQKIHDRTRLEVDITAGSSPHPLLISLPKGRFGRPPLLLREQWSKKGVSVVFLRAVDRKSLGLFALVLVVCCFFLANGAFAAARARRPEVGILRTIGWSQGAIFRALIGELAVIGLAAGAVGTGIAAALVAAFSLNLPLVHTLAVLPLSVALACVAGVVPTWRAARISPLEAVRPRVAGGVPTRRVRRTFRFALVNLRRLPGRTLVSAAGLVIGIAALTLLLGIQRAFQGTLVGTLLGSAIALQVRGVDLTAAALTIVLAAVSVADVLYLNLRERASELVTLRTTGWSDRHLARLVALEALALGLVGSLAGALLGIVLGALFLEVPIGSLALAAALAAAGGTATAFCASLLPLSQIRRLTPPSVLAAE